MFKLIAFAFVALVAVSVVSGAPILSRQTTPTGWDSNTLEPYEDYSSRFLVIGCQNQQSTQFSDDCCQPLKRGEALNSYCGSGANPSPSSALMPRSDSDDDSDDDDSEMDDDDDDYDCEPDHSSSSSPAYEPPSTTPPSRHTPTSTSDSSPPTSTPDSSPPTSTPESSPPTSTSTPDQNSPSGDTHTGGQLTYFYQNGVAGACGQVHSDNDMIAAIDSSIYGNDSGVSSYCGKTIRITWQGNSIDVVVADDCPTCANPSSVDLSVAAFQKLSPLGVGVLNDASWTVVG